MNLVVPLCCCGLFSFNYLMRSLIGDFLFIVYFSHAVSCLLFLSQVDTHSTSCFAPPSFPVEGSRNAILAPSDFFVQMFGFRTSGPKAFPALDPYAVLPFSAWLACRGSFWDPVDFKKSSSSLSAPPLFF